MRPAAGASRAGTCGRTPSTGRASSPATGPTTGAPGSGRARAARRRSNRAASRSSDAPRQPPHGAETAKAGSHANPIGVASGFSRKKTGALVYRHLRGGFVRGDRPTGRLEWPAIAIPRIKCPSGRAGAQEQSRRAAAASALSAPGKRPSAARDQTTCSPTRTSKMPPVPGTSATSPSSAWKVVSSSCAVQPARISHRHCVQYSISTRGVRFTQPIRAFRPATISACSGNRCDCVLREDPLPVGDDVEDAAVAGDDLGLQRRAHAESQPPDWRRVDGSFNGRNRRW